ncbi:twin transmembrane helix small protein [Loktanella sp. D2R18]|uniref:twin transmembrane helix small protein n=1 Tax=Rhodobacterales TaxID=204455 RepID=UPI000DEAC1DA|nr:MULTISPECIES: twin transmembrane helix small protein [Rhodobacterales]MDO6591355.1 twin transmembrane helix small protein [Yoonia sp. 1_MG-2023]RBW46302.1 twin transmembrane helix small protein [Loktanella sp. D2R18]
MANDPFFWIAAISAFAVLAILMFGIGTFAKGGEFNRKHANRIMRWRIGAQFFAVVLIVAFAYLRSSGG